MWVLYIMLLLLIVIILLLTIIIFVIIKKSIYFSDKEKEFIYFLVDIFSEYGKDLGIHSEEQHEQIVVELNKLKKRLSNGRKTE